MKNILEETARKIAENRAKNLDAQLMSYIAKKGFIKHIFGRFLFIWCDTKDLKLNEPNLSSNEKEVSEVLRQVQRWEFDS